MLQSSVLALFPQDSKSVECTLSEEEYDWFSIFIYFLSPSSEYLHCAIEVQIERNIKIKKASPPLARDSILSLPRAMPWCANSQRILLLTLNAYTYLVLFLFSLSNHMGHPIAFCNFCFLLQYIYSENHSRSEMYIYLIFFNHSLVLSDMSGWLYHKKYIHFFIDMYLTPTNILLLKHTPPLHIDLYAHVHEFPLNAFILVFVRHKLHFKSPY